MARLTLELYEGRLHARGAVDKSRPFSSSDQRTLEELARQARSITSSCGAEGSQQAGKAQAVSGESSQLLEIGQALLSWLDGPDGWAHRWVCAGESSGAGRGPELEIRVSFDNIGEAWALLDAPWELLAMDDPMDRPQLTTFLAGWVRPLVVYRRFFEAGDLDLQPRVPSPARHALTVLFMAASPDGQSTLSYDDEERAILDATQDLPLDMLVEETGTPHELANRLVLLRSESDPVLQSAPVQVIHLSCHGTLGRRLGEEPTLLLEDEQGRPMPTTAAQLAAVLENRAVPKLVLLSACLSAAGRAGETMPNTTATSSNQRALAPVEPMIIQLLRAWAPAAVGFADRVADLEATCLAALLYRELAEGQSIETALAWARQQLLTGVLRRKAPLPISLTLAAFRRNGALTPPPCEFEDLLARVRQRGSRHWHLARLMLRMDGGGPVASPRAARRVRRHGTVGSASDVQPERFVGRRRELQQVMRALTTPESLPNAAVPIRGVIIYGAGMVGKSALAYRAVQRSVGSVLAVWVDDFSARGLLVALLSALGPTAPDWLREMPELRAGAASQRSGHLLAPLRGAASPRPSSFFQCFTPNPASVPRSAGTAMEAQQLPASGTNAHSDDEPNDTLEQALRRLLGELQNRDRQGPELLLVLDGIDEILLADESSAPRSRHRVAPEFTSVMLELLRALVRSPTRRIQLIVTSRFPFTLRDDDGFDLTNVLWPLSLPSMSEHEARKLTCALVSSASPTRERCMRLSHGNPGLLSMLLSLLARDESTCLEALTQLQIFFSKGLLPSQGTLQEWFERGSVGAPVKLLSEAEHRLLRATTVFTLPVPYCVIRPLCRALRIPEEMDWQRLIELGVWEVKTDPVNRSLRAVMPSALIRPFIASESGAGGAISETERQVIARAVLPTLLNVWSPAIERGIAEISYQLYELARSAGDKDVLARLNT